MKVDVAGLVAAAQRLLAVATEVQGVGPGEMPPLASDGTSVGAATRLDTASQLLWGSACSQAYSLHTAASHLVMIAARFGGQEEINKAGLTMLLTPVSVLDAGALATLAPVPPVTPDVRIPLPPLQAELTGEAFSQLVTAGSSMPGAGFSTTATNNGAAADTAALAVREMAATVPDLWDSPEGTAALSGRLTEHANALTTISDRWFELGEEARKHADDYSQTVTAVPKPEEFKDNEIALRQAQADGNSIAVSQLIQQRGVLEQRALTEAGRYAAVTETSTSPKRTTAPQTPGAAAPGAGAPASWSRHLRRKGSDRRTPGQGRGNRGQPSRPGRGCGRSAGAAAARSARRHRRSGWRCGGHGGPDPAGAHADRSRVGADRHSGVVGLGVQEAERCRICEVRCRSETRRAVQSQGRRRSGGGGAGDTHPAGALGPPVTPSTSHTPPTMPAGAAQPRANPTPAGGSAMGAMPMGMPLGGLMPHAGQGGDGGADKVTADKKVVVPPQPHTETVTGKVSDRTAAAAAASRNRGESEDPDDGPPRGPILRRITLAPLHDEGHQ